MTRKTTTTVVLLLVLCFGPCKSGWAKFAIKSQAAVNIELTGYNGLSEETLFKGNIPAQKAYEIETAYLGLAMLIFQRGQSYPIIIGDKPLSLRITDPDIPPSFPVGSENELFYRQLRGENPEGKQYTFPLLMIQAKKLLESSHSIHTIKELSTKKKELLKFVNVNYASLKHSDMVRRLITQYFMMHEYVDYHTEGAPATDIKRQYQKAVLDGVKSWLEILKPHIPEYEILNYCVSLYYNRSMVTLASLIIENFKDVAYCPGDKKITFNFPGNLLVTEAGRNREKKLDDFKSEKIIAFVSDKCPVSMVETVVKVRQLAAHKKDKMMIVAPLQELSEKHLAMSRMVSGGKMLFINDEKWRKENMDKKIRLPLFYRLEKSLE